MIFVPLSVRRGLCSLTCFWVQFSLLFYWHIFYICFIKEDGKGKKRYIMKKRIRQYIGLLSAVLAYYAVHEGAHLLYALSTGVFRQINFMGIGMQIGIYEERMSDTGLGIFCSVGVAATMITAYVLTLTSAQICKVKSKTFKACMYYITIAMLLLDPLYLSILCGFFGGGDMNGIALLLPEWLARSFFGVLLVINCVIFWKVVLPKYKEAFAEQ